MGVFSRLLSAATAMPYPWIRRTWAAEPEARAPCASARARAGLGRLPLERSRGCILDVRKRLRHCLLPLVSSLQLAVRRVDHLREPGRELPRMRRRRLSEVDRPADRRLDVAPRREVADGRGPDPHARR